MKYRDLLEGQSYISSKLVWNLLQVNNEEYQKIMKFIMDRADEEVEEDYIKKINRLPYP